MKYSRTSIVVMLAAAEVVLVGLMIFVVHGGFSGGNVFASNGMHRVGFSPIPIAPIAAGTAPHVVIDDVDSFVTVTTSSDGQVHAVDNTRVVGAIWSNGSIAQLTMTRTGDGVRIERPSTPHGFFSLGSFNEDISVAVPAGAYVDITRSSGADVRDLNNHVSIASQDGHISITHIDGDVDAHSNDGHIEATDIHGNSVKLSTADGRLTLRNVTTAELDARTSDGRIEAHGLRIEGAAPRATLHTNDGSMNVSGQFAASGTYELTTDDGRVEFALARGSDVTVNAHTSDGSLTVDGQSFGGDGSSEHSARVGNGSGSMRVSSGDGSIHITTNGAF